MVVHTEEEGKSRTGPTFRCPIRDEVALASVRDLPSEETLAVDQLVLFPIIFSWPWRFLIEPSPWKDR